jgi:hypothetical protein
LLTKPTFRSDAQSKRRARTEPQDDLLGRLGLLVEDGLRLSSVTGLLPVVTPLTLGEDRVLALLVLRDLVGGVLAALLALAVSPASLGNVDLAATENGRRRSARVLCYGRTGRIGTAARLVDDGNRHVMSGVRQARSRCTARRQVSLRAAADKGHRKARGTGTARRPTASPLPSTTGQPFGGTSSYASDRAFTTGQQAWPAPKGQHELVVPDACYCSLAQPTACHLCPSATALPHSLPSLQRVPQQAVARAARATCGRRLVAGGRRLLETSSELLGVGDAEDGGQRHTICAASRTGRAEGQEG